MPRIFDNIERQRLPALQDSPQAARRTYSYVSYDKNKQGEQH